MKKLLSILMLSFLLCASSCEELKKVINGDDDDNPKDPTEEPVKVVKTPCAYFTFDGHFDDLSGNNLVGYGNPEPKFTDGPKGGTKAASFLRTAKTSFIISEGLIDSKNLTVSLWAKDISEGDIFRVTSSSSLSGNVMMSFTCRDGHLKYVVSRLNHYWTSNFDRTGNFTHKSLDDGQWHHIALVSDYGKSKAGASTTILYIDGKKQDTIIEEFNEPQGADAHFGTGLKLTFGGDNAPNMKIANFRVYDSWLMPEKEIKKLYEGIL